MFGLYFLLAVGCITFIFALSFKRLADKFAWEIQLPYRSRWWHKVIAIFSATICGAATVFVMPMFKQGATDLHQLIGGLGDGLALFLIWIPGTIGYTFVAFINALAMLLSATILESRSIGNRKWTVTFLIVSCCQFLAQPHMVSVFDLGWICPLLVYVLVIRFFEDRVRVEEA